MTVTSAATVKCVFTAELGAMVAVIVPTAAMKSQDATPVRTSKLFKDKYQILLLSKG